MSIFIDEMMASFPARNQPPEAIVKFFHWIDAQGLHHNFGTDKWRYANIDPDGEDYSVGIVPVDIAMSKLWTRSDDPAVFERFAEFCRTGGDGSYAGLWLDDTGQQHIVHVGSGSGSTLLGIMVANPVDFLRLLAIGYNELCWSDAHSLTPIEMFLVDNPDAEDEPDEYQWPKKPLALQAWVSQEFGVSIPERGGEVMMDMPSMDEPSDDPFHKWAMSLHE